MKTENNDKLNFEIYQCCVNYQEEYVSGHWYIKPTGLNKIAKALGGCYIDLMPKQRKIFREHCVECAHVNKPIKTWWYYLNCA